MPDGSFIRSLSITRNAVLEVNCSRAVREPHSETSHVEESSRSTEAYKVCAHQQSNNL